VISGSFKQFIFTSANHLTIVTFINSFQLINHFSYSLLVVQEHTAAHSKSFSLTVHYDS
jgi:hypothetical protein